jgi:hypothetical protein
MRKRTWIRVVLIDLMATPDHRADVLATPVVPAVHNAPHHKALRRHRTVLYRTVHFSGRKCYNCSTITIAERAYAAGLFDGDGCVVINLPRLNGMNPTAPRKKGFWLQVLIEQRDKRCIDWLQARWPGHVHHSHGTGFSRDTYHWRWARTAKAAGLFLADIQKFAVYKRDQIDIALEFQSLRLHGKAAIINDIIINRDNLSRLQLQALKRHFV